ncbi:MAG: hypothetical protein HZC49_02085 [Nitrospirae bacterium]|nr:hypothetical protein [Nitrospirota bacterium]
MSSADCDDYDANIYPGGPAARISGVGYYLTLQDAYNAAGNGDTVQGQGVTFTGDFNADLNKTVTIEGGYNCGYSAVTGVTAINGTMTISNGSILIYDMLVQ